MMAFLSWYVLVTLAGVIIWPLVYKVVPALPDRGYAFSKVAGLLVIGYGSWMLTSLGLLTNTPGSTILVSLLLLGLGLFVSSADTSDDDSPWGWLRRNWRYVLTVEALFVVSFVVWLIIRAHQPNIEHTEKPMELAFINGIRWSRTFPPRDPWLSVYSISYYYFGYVILAQLANLSGLPSSIVFNLSVALLFALTVCGSYGLVYNLITTWQQETGDVPTAKSAAWSALFGPLFVAVMGNLIGLLDTLRALNFAWIRPEFWQWLDIIEISEPLQERIWPPQMVRPYPGWWWWRASRVIHDRTPVGDSAGIQPINEFPFFSFLLGDLHPHVLALPFILLALALAFALLCQRARVTKSQIIAAVMIFGGLAFLNAWDLPIYAFILVCIIVLRHFREAPVNSPVDLLKPVGIGVGIILAGAVIYLPWYIGFTSQAGGILPNALFPTRFHQFFMMFGVFLIITVFLLVDSLRDSTLYKDWWTGGVVTTGLILLLVTAMGSLGIIALQTDPGVRAYVLESLGYSTLNMTAEQIDLLIPQVIGTILRYRLIHPITPLILGAGILSTVTLLAPYLVRPATTEHPNTRRLPDTATTFALVLVLTALLLTIGPEFVYLRDNFGQRINTIFKFYYAAWLLFAIAAAFAAHKLLTRRAIVSIPFGVLLTLGIASGLLYTIFAVPARTGEIIVRNPAAPAPTLDGLAYLVESAPGDYEAIQWVIDNIAPDDIILETVGGAYSRYGRVSAISGRQTVLGWANHERQWRGEFYPQFAGSREQDVAEIYSTPNIRRALELLHQYQVDYIFVGSLEMADYGATSAGISKFERYFTPVYQNSGATIYAVDTALSEELP